MSYTFAQDGTFFTGTGEGDTVYLPNSTDTVENREKLKKQIQQNFVNKRGMEMQIQESVSNNQHRDDTYMGGNLARQDYSVVTTEGQRIVGLLNATWPDEVASYTSHDNNLVAEFTPLRQPYTNNSISWYCFDEAPDSVKTAYSLNYSSYNPWYGLKFDTVTEEVRAKIVVTKDSLLSAYPNALDNITLPWFWNLETTFFARIHSKDGSVDERVDAYFFSTETLMKEWCDDNSHTYPYDTTVAGIKDNLMCFGITFNVSTGIVEHVKAYTRNYI